MSKGKKNGRDTEFGGQLIANDKNILIFMFLITNGGSGLIGTLSGITLQSPKDPAIEGRVAAIVQTQEEHGRGLANLEASFREYKSDVLQRETRYIREAEETREGLRDIKSDIARSEKRIATMENALKAMKRAE